MKGMLFLSLKQLEIIIYGHVRKYVKLSPFSIILSLSSISLIFILDLDQNYIDKL